MAETTFEVDTSELDSLILLGEARALVRVIYSALKSAPAEALNQVAGYNIDLDGDDLVSLSYAASVKLDEYHRIANEKAVSRG